MQNWTTTLQRGLVSGAASSILSTVALAIVGKKETGSAFAPTNAVSHYVHGDKAALHSAPSMRYTVPGYLIHHASSTFWSIVFERVAGRYLDRKTPVGILTASAATSAFAAFADYKLTPKRFQPGYEKRLSTPSLAFVYAALALGLAAGAAVSRRDEPPRSV
ncbi:hypothetical protein [Massilia yuzhufengensis]|uniref:Uncharacterized protein n=1 Tax=Massilia yuzhufengensis TaxID=1164594 RepID=A0A1I1DDQ0_9BURK|nr:hypothetical protein [Massilia yuzhufengensis]SFB71188.1 hypothetical protein SAMN05216204_10176 [Massilia yuzhufengensis]